MRGFVGSVGLLVGRGLVAGVLCCQMGVAMGAGGSDVGEFERVLAQTDQEMIALEFEDGAPVERGLERLGVWPASVECEREFVRSYMGVYVGKVGYAESLKKLRGSGESDVVLNSWEDHWIVEGVVSRGLGNQTKVEGVIWKSLGGGVPPVRLKAQEGMRGRWASASAVVVEVQDGLAKGGLRWLTPAELLCGFERE